MMTGTAPPVDTPPPSSVDALTAAQRLEALRQQILQSAHNQNAQCFDSLCAGLPVYGQEIHSLLQARTWSPDELQSLHSAHLAFDEKLRATLLSARAAVQRELQAVQASQHYASGECDRFRSDVTSREEPSSRVENLGIDYEG